MLDYVQAAFWSLTYVFLIIYAIKFKRHGIPLASICLNFAWETVALGQSLMMGEFTGSLIVHIAWFSLDLVILLLFLFCETPEPKVKWKKWIFLISYVCSSVLLMFVFSKGYMLLSCFVIDLIMAVDFIVFVLFRRVKKHWISYVIGGSKLIGDMCAWLFYRDAFSINFIGSIVLLCNLVYVSILLCKPNDQGLLCTDPI
ncbi:MAG: hypothetical protein IJW70_10125 [Clostridia bacterium]|nr:hypothetical protein [Clostridia bacterium]